MTAGLHRVWQRPDGPGPEVTALADRDGRVWTLGRPMQPEQDARPDWWCDGQCSPFDQLLFHCGPLTELPTEVVADGT
jgi:hypothetical protein